MSYTPTNWKAGDTVTSAKLNKMEQGIANNINILIVEITTDEETEKQVMNKTWQEILDADYAICVEYVEIGKIYYSINSVVIEEGTYMVNVPRGNRFITFEAQSADEYPMTSSSENPK